MNERCPHCPPFAQPVILSTALTLARLAPQGRRTNPGYMLVTTRRHIAHLTDLDWPELVDLSSVAARVAAGLRAALVATKVTVRVNWGPPGQHTPHLHVHLVPRFPGDGHDGFLPGPLEDLTSPVDPGLPRRLRRKLPKGSTRGGTPTPVTCELRRHPIDETMPGRPCAAVVVPSDGAEGSGVGLASALLAITSVASEVIGTGRVTGVTIRLAAGSPEPSQGDGMLMVYPRWPDDGFVGARA